MTESSERAIVAKTMFSPKADELLDQTVDLVHKWRTGARKQVALAVKAEPALGPMIAAEIGAGSAYALAWLVASVEEPKTH